MCCLCCRWFLVQRLLYIRVGVRTRLNAASLLLVQGTHSLCKVACWSAVLRRQSFEERLLCRKLPFQAPEQQGRKLCPVQVPAITRRSTAGHEMVDSVDSAKVRRNSAEVQLLVRRREARQPPGSAEGIWR